MDDRSLPAWIPAILKLAAVYNILWGIWVVSSPHSFFQLFGLAPMLLPQIWQSVGMIVGVYGIAYYFAALSPAVQWPIIFVGWLGKFFGTIGVFYNVVFEGFPWPFIIITFFNDILWLIPFSIILYMIFRRSQDTFFKSQVFHSVVDALASAHARSGKDLLQLSYEKPLMLIFLRHFGCTFCRETLSTIKSKYPAITDEGTQIVLVHMATPETGSAWINKYGLDDIEHISDPQCLLYDFFRLQRGRFAQVFGWKNWKRGFWAGILKRHGIGMPIGDGFRMPGVFLIAEGKILKSYKHRSAADQPNYEAMAKIEDFSPAPVSSS